MQRTKSKKEEKSTLLWLSVYSCALIIFFCIMYQFNWKEGASEDYKRNHPSAKQIGLWIRDISLDNKTLLFGYGSPYSMKLGTYNLSTGQVHVYNTGEINKMNYAPSFSNDGEKIVFIASRERDYTTNIYIVNTDGTDLRQITKNLEVKNDNIIHAEMPSFSPDKKRVIYMKSHRKRTRVYPLSGEMNSDWDIYEVEIETGAERKLTNYNFYEICGPPFYMPDGKQFLFAGEGLYNPTGKGPKDFKEYEMKYQKNFIFIINGKENELKPAFTNGSNSKMPSVSSDNAILFLSEATENDGSKITQDLYLYKNDNISRLTRLNSYIVWAKISRSGSHIIFYKKNEKTDPDWSDWIINTDGSSLKEINIPLELLKK